MLTFRSLLVSAFKFRRILISMSGAPGPGRNQFVHFDQCCVTALLHTSGMCDGEQSMDRCFEDSRADDWLSGIVSTSGNWRTLLPLVQPGAHFFPL